MHKKINFIQALFAGAFAVFLFSNNLIGTYNAGNGGHTGAPAHNANGTNMPAEAKCNSCHRGSAGFSANMQNVSISADILDPVSLLPITTYTPGNNYILEYRVSGGTSVCAYGVQGFLLRETGFPFGNTYGTPTTANTGTLSSPSVFTRISTGAQGQQYLENQGRNASGIFRANWASPTATGNGLGAILIYGDAIGVDTTRTTPSDSMRATSANFPNCYTNNISGAGALKIIFPSQLPMPPPTIVANKQHFCMDGNYTNIDTDVRWDMRSQPFPYRNEISFIRIQRNGSFAPANSSSGLFNPQVVTLSLPSGVNYYNYRYYGDYWERSVCNVSAPGFSRPSETYVQVHRPDSIELTYPQNTYCTSTVGSINPTISGRRIATDDPMPMNSNLPPLVGSLAYSASPAGLSINNSTGSIDPSTSQLGTYVITCITSGLTANPNTGDLRCRDTATTTLTIGSSLSAPTISYASAVYCTTASNPSPSILGTTGGNFSSQAGLGIDNLTGVLNLSGSQAGNYTVQYQVSNTCGSVSATASVSISLCSNPVGVAEQTMAPGYKIFPNPSKDILHIQGIVPTAYTSIQLLDMQGRVVLQTNNIGTLSDQKSLDISQFAEGAYMLRVNETVFKVIIQK